MFCTSFKNQIIKPCQLMLWSSSFFHWLIAKQLLTSESWCYGTNLFLPSFIFTVELYNNDFAGESSFGSFFHFCSLIILLCYDKLACDRALGFLAGVITKRHTWQLITNPLSNKEVLVSAAALHRSCSTSYWARINKEKSFALNSPADQSLYTARSHKAPLGEQK